MALAFNKVVHQEHRNQEEFFCLRGVQLMVMCSFRRVDARLPFTKSLFLKTEGKLSYLARVAQPSFMHLQ